MKKLLIGLLIVALIVVGVLIAVLGKNSNNTNSSSSNSMNMPAQSKTNNNASTQPAPQNTVTISNFAFSPANVTVKVGTTVTWTNHDPIAHTVTADQPSADAPSSGNIDQGKTYSFTFKKAGTYAYHCTPHPYMKGSVIVTE